MTKREREQFLHGINPLTGQALNLPPAPASPLPGWVVEAQTERARHLASPPEADRPWSFVGTGTSNSGRDTAIFQTGMKNGGSFQATLPGDLVRALRAGKVPGLKY
jgi:hypothetical protein